MTDPQHSGTDITGIVLAGGRNSRMGGQHKALLPWRDRPFIAHIVERLQPQVAALAISSNRAELFADLRLPVVADPFADQRGPLAGMLAGLRFSRTPQVLFAPCDNPHLSPHLAARLAQALQDTDVDIAYAVTGSDEHYLYALMRTNLAAGIERFLQAGNSAVRQWYALHRCRQVRFDDEAAHFININSPADLSQLDRPSPARHP